MECRFCGDPCEGDYCSSTCDELDHQKGFGLAGEENEDDEDAASMVSVNYPQNDLATVQDYTVPDRTIGLDGKSRRASKVSGGERVAAPKSPGASRALRRFFRGHCSYRPGDGPGVGHPPFGPRPVLPPLHKEAGSPAPAGP